MENQNPSTDLSAKKGDEAKEYVEKYFKVIFSDKTSPSDTDDVELSVNAETLVIKRGVEVIIPGRFKECADHARFPQFQQLPGKQRKLRGYVKIYPYTLLGEATKAQFNRMKKEGDRQTKEVIAKFGFNGVPEGD